MGLFDRVAATLTGGDPLPDDARDHITLALALADRGGLSEAEERLAALATQHPRAVSVQMALGEVRARRGDDEGAVTAFGRAVDLSGDALDAWLGLGDALGRLGRADPARDAYRRVLSGASDAGRRARAHAGRGRLALASGRVAKAVRELRKAAELLPADLEVAADLGRALLADRDPEGWQWMLRAAQGAVEAGGALDAALVIEAAQASPKRDAAESLLRGALARAPGGVTGARLSAALGQHLAETGQGEEARALGTAALATAADDAVVLASWRVIAEASGDPREALRAAARAAELGAPASPEVLVRLGLAAGDREALARAAAGDHALAAPLRAFLAGSPAEDDVVRLGAVAPSPDARRFLAQSLAPGDPPPGNLFALLAFARDLATRTPELAALLPAASRAAEALDRPLLVAVMGEFNAGKSSFVNALCGEEVAPVGVTPTTATINVLRYGPPGARVLYQDGRAEELSAGAVTEFLAGLGENAASVRMVEIFFPLEVLRRVEVVDTPGLNSLRPEHERVARGFLTEADAIIWLFALGQAAKASERDALGLAHGAHKRVLGVLNKADQAEPAELERLLGYVRSAMGDRIEALLPLSARDAVRARKRGDEAQLDASGLPALLQALEERFFHEARTLKRQTALTALGRFVDEARALAGQPGEDSAPAAFAQRREALDRHRTSIDAALAAERVGLRGRLEEAFRRAAAEVLEFVRPRRWPFGERRAEAADEEFLFDLLEDAVVQASEATRRLLEDAAGDGPAVPIAAAVERFRAYARGVLAGGLVTRFLHEQLPAAGGRVELAALQRSLARSAPDVDAELIQPLATEVEAAYAAARAALADEELRAAMRSLVREERLTTPLAALERAAAAL